MEFRELIEVFGRVATTPARSRRGMISVGGDRFKRLTNGDVGWALGPVSTTTMGQTAFVGGGRQNPRSGFADGDGALDFVGLESECHRTDNVWQHGHVVEFADQAFDSQPVGDVAGPEVDDQQAAAGIRAAFGQLIIQCEAAECFVVARPRQAHHGVIADEGEAAQVARTKCQRFEAASVGVQAAEVSGARVVQPELAAVQSRRVGHRQSRGDHATVGNLQDHSTVVTPVAPAIDDVARADRGGIAWATVGQSQAVEVAAVLAGQLAEERRMPARKRALLLNECPMSLRKTPTSPERHSMNQQHSSLARLVTRERDEKSPNSTSNSAA